MTATRSFVAAAVPRVVQVPLFLALIALSAHSKAGADGLLLALSIAPLAAAGLSASTNRSYAADEIGRREANLWLRLLQACAVTSATAALLVAFSPLKSVAFVLSSTAVSCSSAAQFVSSDIARVDGKTTFANWTAGLSPSPLSLAAGLVAAIVAKDTIITVSTVALVQASWIRVGQNDGPMLTVAVARRMFTRTVQQLLNLASGQLDVILVAALLEPTAFAVYSLSRRLIVFAIGPLTVTNSLCLPLFNRERMASPAGPLTIRRTSRPGATATALALVGLPVFGAAAGSLLLPGSPRFSLALTLIAMATFELINPYSGPAVLGLSQYASPTLAAAVSVLAILLSLSAAGALAVAGTSDPAAIAAVLSAASAARFLVSERLLRQRYAVDVRPFVRLRAI